MKPLNGISSKNGSEPPLLEPLDLATLFYVLFSTIYMCFGLSSLEHVFWHTAMRVGVTVLVFGLAFLDKRSPSPIVSFFRNLYPILIVGYFYAETSYFKNIFIATNLDPFFSAIELSVFGCQPSLRFCQAIPYKWFNELMNICYFSYYVITLVVCVALYVVKGEKSYRSIFIVVFSFYLYYIIFTLLPVVGPQFYFSAKEAAMERPYLFGKIMYYLLTTAEKPTGAFPSSHVGIALILVWITYRQLPKLFWFTWPFALGICFATVYLKAHYLLDVFAGIASVPLFIFISNKVYTALNVKYESAEVSFNK
jgi:membrane-associated phospholipid phosphatase